MLPPTPDAGGPAGGGDAGGAGTGDAVTTDDGANDATDAGGCGLLAAACPLREACYPFPFEGPARGETQCAFQGVGGATVPCQSQLECDGTTICSAPGQSDSVCAPRCDRAAPRCAVGTACVAYPGYPGVGVCL